MTITVRLVMWIGLALVLIVNDPQWSPWFLGAQIGALIVGIGGHIERRILG